MRRLRSILLAAALSAATLASAAFNLPVSASGPGRPAVQNGAEAGAAAGTEDLQENGKTDGGPGESAEAAEDPASGKNDSGEADEGTSGDVHGEEDHSQENPSEGKSSDGNSSEENPSGVNPSGFDPSGEDSSGGVSSEGRGG